MSWKFIALSSVAATALTACASPETKVLQPYTLANGATYQDVVSIGANGKGTAPTVTQVKTFELGRKGASLVTDASGYEPSIGTTVVGAAVGGLASSVPGAIAYRHRKVTVKTNGTGTPTAPTTVPSDIRLKRDIASVGQLTNGLTLYRFRYLWSSDIFVGVMAQDVLEFMPEAVIVGQNGYMAVNYALLGFTMLRWEEWVLFSRLGTLPYRASETASFARAV